MESKRTNRRTSRTSQRKQRDKLEEVVQQEQQIQRRRRTRRAANVEESAPEPKSKGRRRKRIASSDRVIHLAMSPRAANILRALLGKARYDEPELDKIKAELEDQLDNPQ